MSGQLNANFAQPNISPKQQNSFPQPGRLSPGSMSNISKNYGQSSTTNRKSLSSAKLDVNFHSNHHVFVIVLILLMIFLFSFKINNIYRNEMCQFRPIK